VKAVGHGEEQWEEVVSDCLFLAVDFVDYWCQYLLQGGTSSSDVKGFSLSSCFCP
jgi:hypothetical protein